MRASPRADGRTAVLAEDSGPRNAAALRPSPRSISPPVAKPHDPKRPHRRALGRDAPCCRVILRYQARAQKSSLVRALQEHGRVLKSLFALRWIADESYRRRIGRQINKGEALHALRRYLMFANEGKVKLPVCTVMGPPSGLDLQLHGTT